jgi:hypothetical protein
MQKGEGTMLIATSPPRFYFCCTRLPVRPN